MTKPRLTKAEKHLIDDLARTKTIRELSRVLLSYLTVEEMSQFISTFLMFKKKGASEWALNYFLRDQFFPLVKTVTFSLGDWLPDFLSDGDFMDLFHQLPKKKLFFKKT